MYGNNIAVIQPIEGKAAEGGGGVGGGFCLEGGGEEMGMYREEGAEQACYDGPRDEEYIEATRSRGGVVIVRQPREGKAAQKEEG
jgi:hypothetical protein